MIPPVNNSDCMLTGLNTRKAVITGWHPVSGHRSDGKGWIRRGTVESGNISIRSARDLRKATISFDRPELMSYGSIRILPGRLEGDRSDRGLESDPLGPPFDRPTRGRSPLRQSPDCREGTMKGITLP